MSSTGKVKGKSESIKADIVVMGSGGGLTAAVTAAEAGASVILLEKAGILGGFTRQANGLMACGSPVQKRHNVNLSTDEVFHKYMSWNHWNRADPRIVRAYLNKTGDTIRWLEEEGVEFEFRPPMPAGSLHIIHFPVGAGAALQKTLARRGRELGVKILLNCSGQQILLGKQGNVTGVIAVNEKEGKAFEITARSVVIATGGFGNNRQLLKKYCPDYYDGMPLCSWPNHSAHNGDGLLMAEAIGAAIADSVPIYHLGPYRTGFNYPWQSLFAIATNRFTVWLNKRGKRFLDESRAGGVLCGNAIFLQPDKVMYSVFDDELRDDVEIGRITDEVHKADVKGKTHPGLKEKLLKLADSGGGMISDSWEDIARWMGAQSEVLQAEIEEYNSYCARGHDEIFARNPLCMRPLRTPPYYAIKCYSSVTETLGGIKVNERMEVQDKQGNIIPGVYAAGAIADGCHGQTYCLDVAGTTMGFAINSGRIAGESAAEFVLH